uniref:Uncharacterized protein n=1 Tax=Rhizophora mucronata TaxID=61149 RepID=A0A2P2MHU6_RHIMU
MTKSKIVHGKISMRSDNCDNIHKIVIYSVPNELLIQEKVSVCSVELKLTNLN